MTFLLKFIDSGFLLTLGLILLISGAIMLYCYRRLNLLEKSVIEHGKILQNFILNYNVQMQNLGTINNIPFENENYKNDAMIDDNNGEEEIKKINLEEKIYVSDDDNDSVGNESKNKNEESDNEESDNEESYNEESDDEESYNEESDNEESYNEESDNSHSDGENEKIKNLNISKEDLGEDLGDLENIELKKSAFSNSDEENFMNNIPISLETFNIDINNKSKIINLESDDQANEISVTERKNYSKMKVDDLKSLIVTKNILDNESVQKMKKTDLVKLLQNN